MTNILKFKCTLESDLVLTQTTGSTGNQKTLDFIPGNNFLGIVAGQIYQDDLKKSLDIFHSGKVRFGDAHPSANGIRGLKVPASMYYPKLGSASEECYIHHLTDHTRNDIKAKQLKQCREGFFCFGSNTGTPVAVQKNFTIKSAYDSNTRRSKDGQMFGYESLSKGLVLYFEVESELDEAQNKAIVNALCGRKHIGHSRSAEFGLIIIEQLPDYQETESRKQNAATDCITVYADGRLIFMDKNKEFTFQPTPEDLGLTGGEIDWEKSQIRIFQYAPWNGKRHTYEADRCGIEKGSVFVIKSSGATCPDKSRYVGCFKNEGFGKVIYNPVFLEGNPDGGRARFTLEEMEQEAPQVTNAVNPGSPLVSFLERQRRAAESNQTVYRIVQDEVRQLENIFKKGKFASQWGSIRSLAMVFSNSRQLIDAIDEFLSHGVAQAKWEEQNRKGRLDSFMEQHANEDLQSIMINLASEMAKKCKAREED